ncbi:UDP-glucose 4-epimerase GalE [Glaciimonas sp. PCH181]|uniref:UDP-glucose 4-epimerase GalE n=1 Tax=Glaciimonas sp. PCH181 TaxID=2133943 RepID=UPI000D3BBF17|nr:UDP-glucose 4-epimerase GalE [Glaciimonas sp. PCH181]PUA17485.1 UDP-glucose 4-epimerase GalE [Glaciimonas sp. PCH181]
MNNSNKSAILLTGATGYIGSHTWVELLNAGHDVIGVDNLVNSSPVVLDRIQKITGKKPHFVEANLCDRAATESLFNGNRIGAAIHFAALKSVGESVAKPVEYYANNLGALLTLCSAMTAAGVDQLVFSSSATVYGNPATVPIREDFPLSATNPYGQTKLMGEQMLRDLEISNDSWKVAYLRYFNPVGAHESGLIGEDPRGTPNNLMPYIARVAAKRSAKLSVFGSDYPTVDGTGVRDYIHVVDLAKAHLAALAYLQREQKSLTTNIGTGSGYSVLEVIAAYEKASDQPVPYDLVPRRPGDIASCYADPSLAAELLGWRAERGLAAMCADSWKWQSLNPLGFEA